MQRSTAVPHRGYPLPCPLPVPTMAFGLKMLACKGFPYQFNSIQVKLSIQYKEDETSADIVGVWLAFGSRFSTVVLGVLLLSRRRRSCAGVRARCARSLGWIPGRGATRLACLAPPTWRHTARSESCTPARPRRSPLRRSQPSSRFRPRQLHPRSLWPMHQRRLEPPCSPHHRPRACAHRRPRL